MQLSNTRQIAYHARMICTATPLLTRLRRYRGLWLLAFAAMLIKLVTSSICLGDAPTVRLAVTQVTTTLTLAMDSTSSDTTVDEACLLGEAGDCHCACAHALTLTPQAALPIATVIEALEPSRLSLGLVPDTTGSLLRPPIA